MTEFEEAKPNFTIGKYLEDTYLYEWNSNILSIEEINDPTPKDLLRGTYKIICDSTIFHPQGGGQPSDIGVLLINSCEVFTVNFVQKNLEGLIEHYGFPTSISSLEILLLNKNHNDIKMKINEDIRNSSARNHSAGHCIDVCFNRIDAVNNANGIETTPYSEILRPTKGYHFTDGCYVEYELFPNQKLSELQLKSIPDELNLHLVNLIQEDIPTIVSNCNKSEVESLCSIDTTHYPDQIRLVQIAGGYCPCGGTHITSTNQLREVVITKIKCKKGIVKINYIVNY